MRCHQLRMHGAEPDFYGQDKVVAWMEKGVDWFGFDPNMAPQPAEPRLFKSRLPYGAVPAGGKMIYCFRDLKDVVVSAYHFANTMAQYCVGESVCQYLLKDWFK